MDEFIEPERLKIYAVLAGSLVWRTSLGETVNVCEDLDWKRALGMHLWSVGDFCNLKKIFVFNLS